MQSNVPSAVVMRAMPSIEIVRVAVPWSRAVPLSINTVCMDDSLRSGAFDINVFAHMSRGGSKILLVPPSTESMLISAQDPSGLN